MCVNLPRLLAAAGSFGSGLSGVVGGESGVAADEKAAAAVNAEDGEKVAGKAAAAAAAAAVEADAEGASA